MRKKQIIKIALTGILIALGIVLKKFSIDTGHFRISLYDTPILLVGIIGGPIYGVISAFLVDLFYSFMSGYAYSFIMAISTLVWGICGGLFYKRNIRFIPLLLCILSASVLNTAINSIQLAIWYGGASMLAGLPLRLCNMLIKLPITTALVFTIYNLLRKEIYNLCDY